MNNTQIDYLIQLPLPRTDGVGQPGRGREEGSLFETHFQIVSASSTAAPPPVSSRSKQDRDDNRRRTDLENPSAPEPIASQGAEASRSTDVQDDTRGESSTLGEAAEVANVAALNSPAESEQNEGETEAANAKIAGGASENPAANEDKLPTTESADLDAQVRKGVAEEPLGEGIPTSSTEPETTTDPKRKVTAQNEGENGKAEAKSVLTEELPIDARRNSKSPPSGEVIARSEASTGKDATDAKSPDARAEHSEPTAKEAAQLRSATTKQNENPLEQAVISDEVGVEGSSNRKRSQKGEKKVLSTGRTAEKPLAAQASADAASRPQVANGPTTAAAVTPTVDVADGTKGTGANTGQVSKVSGESKEGALASLARFERGSLLGTRFAKGSEHAHEVRQIDPARFVNRVARAIQTAQDRGTPLLLRLSPPELGALRLELSMQQGALSATVETDNQSARQLLLDNLPALRDRLAEQNIRVERFDVDVRRDGDARQQPGFNAQQQHEGRDGGGNHRPNLGQHSPTAAAPEPEVLSDVTITTSSINVVA